MDSTPTKDFEGKVAFVTGAASGMGLATSELLAKRGASVALIDLRKAEVEQAAADVAKTYGVKTIGLAVDVANWEQVEAAVKETVAQLGRLDCAFNAAGLPGRIGPGYLLADYPPADWQRMMNVNADGVFFCVKAQIQAMLAAGTPGSIVNVASTASERVFPWCSAYVTAKHAVQGITRSAAVEYSHMGIRTNSVAPGYTDTRMLIQAPPGTRERAMAQTPMGKLGTPEDIAELAVFLMSDKSGFMTGGYYPIDGGFLCAKPGPLHWMTE